MKNMKQEKEVTMADIKQMMLKRVPRRKIAELTGYSMAELCHFAIAWEIPAYGEPGRPRKERLSKVSK